ncbi:unnamed protein product [Malus baccata var. baccata]
MCPKGLDNAARFKFSHCTHDYHQETLDNLRTAMNNMEFVVLLAKILSSPLTILFVDKSMFSTSYKSLPGVIVGLPTLLEKDKIDILECGVPNGIDIIALSFVRKGSDLVEVRKVLGKHAKNIMLMSQIVCTLGLSSGPVEMCEKLLRAWMNAARFKLLHGTHDYHQETLDNLRTAMNNTEFIVPLCWILRVPIFEQGKPINLKQDKEIIVTTDYMIR